MSSNTSTPAPSAHGRKLWRALWGLPPEKEKLVEDESWRNEVTFGDIERCPYSPFDPRAELWLEEDDLRIKARVLNRRAARR
jgi:hypothetical protein